MGKKTKLGDLLLRWEDFRRQGKHISADDLCRDCPELRNDLQWQIRALEGMERLGISNTEDGSINVNPAANEKTNRPRTRYDDLRPGLEPVPGYRLEKRLGKGGFGEVWKATGAGGFPVALKFVPLSGKVGPSEFRSLEILKSLHHPNLLATFGSWQAHGFLVIAMELADRTLLDRLHEALSHASATEIPRNQEEEFPYQFCQDQPSQGTGIGIPRDELLGYMQEAAKGIDYLNAQRHEFADQGQVAIQHRDIKPQNILLVGDGVKISDFGLMRILKNTTTEHTGSLTVAYAAPEFFDGQTSRSSDQYSLAVTYCHLRGGRLPFTGHAGQIMAGHLKGPPDLTMVPEAERPAVLRALAKDPAKRWPTCGAFVEALKLSHIPTGIPFRRRKWITPLLIASSLLLGIFLIWFFWNSFFPDHPFQNSTNPEKLPKQPEHPKLPNFFRPGEDASKAQKKIARRLKLPIEIINLIGMKLILIPPGEFQMGSPETEEGRFPDEVLHPVEISRPFFMGVFEVTQDEYTAVTGKNPSRFREGRHPVDRVSWREAAAFCERLSKKEGERYRLPTEAEWEYACRAGTTTRTYFGTTVRLDQANIRGQGTKPVGSYSPNPFGLFDMYGNVWEWCADWYGDESYFRKSPRVDPLGPLNATTKVLRGGGWFDAYQTKEPTDRRIRSATRYAHQSPDSRNDRWGFRVVREIQLLTKEISGE
jgi:formylglycine-generating enzyme required for sulfatase activity